MWKEWDRFKGDAQDAEAAANALALALEASDQDWKASFQKMTDACKSCHETSAPRRRRAVITSSLFRNDRMAMRLIGIAGLLALGLGTPMSNCAHRRRSRLPG